MRFTESSLADIFKRYIANNECDDPKSLNKYYQPLSLFADIDFLEIKKNQINKDIWPKRLLEPICPLKHSASLQTKLVDGEIDIAHNSKRQVASKVDSKKLEKAELKLQKKLIKRKTGVQVAFTIVGKTVNAPNQLSDEQIKDILNARGKFNDVHLNDIDLSIAGQRILQGANLSLVFGRKYGLIGRNGIGKSTLLRAIVARQIPDMEKYKHVSIGYLEQELENDSDTCLDCVLKADVYRTYLLKQEEELNSDPEQLKEIHEKMVNIEASTAETRAASVLAGLGFNSEMQKRPVSEFSGGWRMRIALARALFVKPDLLLLDEPTNHLDIPAVVWLSEYLARWKSTLLVVSHDREFLDYIATDILHMHDERLDTYKGNFTSFEGSREERRRTAMREYEAQMLYRKGLQDFVDKWRYNAKRAAQAQSKIKILEKLPEIEVPCDEVAPRFVFPTPDHLGSSILQLRQVWFAYGRELVLQDVSLDVQMNSRIAIVGPNGAGKSTVLKLLTGSLEPSKGQAFRHQKLRFGFFSQHHVDALQDQSLSPVEFLAKQCPGVTQEEYRRHLGSFGISGRVGLRSMSTLSGGQKSRVVFASIAIQKPNVILLDEPTNHLDYLSVDALSDALNAFSGGVIIVSHDQRFIDACCTEIWVCQDKHVTKFTGDGIKDYKCQCAANYEFQ